MTHPIPLDKLEAHTLVVGTTGSGKTYLTRGLLEQLRAGDRRVGAIDKMGNMWGVTASADGKRAGLEFVVFGGKRAHVAMTPADGAKLGQLFGARGFPAIFDVSQWKRDDQESWVADFADALFETSELSTHLVLDEAQSWVPQGGGGEAFRSVQRLAEQGRGNGIHLVIAVQRMARLDATVRGMMQGVTIALRQTTALDRKAVREHVGGDDAAIAALYRDLPTLPAGTGFLYDPASASLERVAFPANATFDSSRTPRHGDTPPAPVAVSGALVDELRKALAPPAPGTPLPDDAIPADPIEALRKGGAAGTMMIKRDERIKALEQELFEAQDACGHLQANYDGLVQLNALYSTAFDAIGTILERTSRGEYPLLDKHSETSAGPAGGEVMPAATSTSGAARGARSAAGRGAGLDSEGASATVADAPPAAGAPDREYRALAVLADVHPLGLTEPAWAARAGMARKGGAWIRRRKRYLDGGLIELRDGRWSATGAGIEAAGADIPDMPPAGMQLVKWWSGRLDRAAGRALELLAAFYPKALTRDAIAVELGMSAAGGAFSRAISAIKSAELAFERGKRLAIAPSLMGDE